MASTNLQRLGKLAIGQTAIEILQNDLALELQTVPRLNKGIQLCRDVGDNGSEDLLTRILVDSEQHVDWLESQLELVKQVGEAHFLAQQIRGKIRPFFSLRCASSGAGVTFGLLDLKTLFTILSCRG